ncbi:hypothetical protein [Bacillus sp. S/N-304-OC-R1]|uniref:DUF7210 family protein n=1 Tax=Bacillus sp. S/N-304-OC-R1 TaxID=2758034 RepID=UPI001C8D45C9|nr:hypothetical protein [Bacillus sp. S/N-304-OC-R1]MBY0122159.1 hypothetical protein [Bacillus sp. S/N-304-OC-R1]
MTQDIYKNLTVEEVLEAVKNEQLSAEKAFEYESQGKNRKTLLEALKEMTAEVNDSLEDSNEPNSSVNDPLETISVVLTENVKFGNTRYKIGNKIDVSPDDYEVLLKAGVIQEDA